MKSRTGARTWSDSVKISGQYKEETARHDEDLIVGYDQSRGYRKPHKCTSGALVDNNRELLLPLNMALVSITTTGLFISFDSKQIPLSIEGNFTFTLGYRAETAVPCCCDRLHLVTNLKPSIGGDLAANPFSPRKFLNTMTLFATKVTELNKQKQRQNLYTPNRPGGVRFRTSTFCCKNHTELGLQYSKTDTNPTSIKGSKCASILSAIQMTVLDVARKCNQKGQLGFSLLFVAQTKHFKIDLVSVYVGGGEGCAPARGLNTQHKRNILHKRKLYTVSGMIRPLCVFKCQTSDFQCI